MDPRHPELAVARVKELVERYDEIESGIASATTSSKIGQLEREGGLIIQEICLVAPRLHEAMMQVSRQRRHDLSRGILVEPQDTSVELPYTPEEKVGKYVKATIGASEDQEEQATEPKPKKKRTVKKKKAE